MSGQTKKEVEITYLNRFIFQKVLKAGDKQIFTQLCTTQIDSIIQGTINFNKASVGPIMDCQMSMRVLADTIRNYKIKTINSESTTQLTDATMKVCLSPTEKQIVKGKTIYIWKEPFNDSQIITSTLKISKNYKKELFISQIE